MRSQDPFGRMKVEWTNISKANVCPYMGREIPGYKALGLDAAKVYMLWRHPQELAKAAHTFDMVPLMDEHIVTDAANPELHAVAGTIGSGVRFKYPYLQAPLAIWVGDSVDDVKTRRKRQLSCGYGYTPDMTPGQTPEGVAYDGVMRHIIGNHVTIVKDGRAGPDVLVADEDPFIEEAPVMKRKPVVDAVVTALAGVTLTPEQQTALDVALDSAIAPLEVAARDAGKKDADGDNDGDKKKPVNAKEHGEACDCGAKGCGKSMAKDSVTKEQAQQLANDAAAAAVKLALGAERALVAARQDVADLVGNVALDSAEAVYRHSLAKEKVAGHDTIHASALATVWGIHKAGKVAGASQAHDAQVDAPSADARAALASIGL